MFWIAIFMLYLAARSVSDPMSAFQGGFLPNIRFGGFRDLGIGSFAVMAAGSAACGLSIATFLSKE